MRYRDASRRSSAPIGALLILAGLALLLATQTGLNFLLAPGVVGVFFLAAYGYRRLYGLLVAGCILTGLGAGLAIDDFLGLDGAAVILGLGTGFVAIFAVDALRGLHRAHWWPLLPGAILLLAGFDAATGRLLSLAWLADWWPVLLVALGVLILVRGASRRRPRA